MNRLKQTLSKITQWFLPLVSGSTYGKCKHLNKNGIYKDYRDAYIEYECLDCGERIFEHMYNK